MDRDAALAEPAEEKKKGHSSQPSLSDISEPPSRAAPQLPPAGGAAALAAAMSAEQQAHRRALPTVAWARALVDFFVDDTAAFRSGDIIRVTTVSTPARKTRQSSIPEEDDAGPPPDEEAPQPPDGVATEQTKPSVRFASVSESSVAPPPPAYVLSEDQEAALQRQRDRTDSQSVMAPRSRYQAADKTTDWWEGELWRTSTVNDEDDPQYEEDLSEDLYVSGFVQFPGEVVELLDDQEMVAKLEAQRQKLTDLPQLTVRVFAAHDHNALAERHVTGRSRPKLRVSTGRR